jgi:hypothetical protein
MAAVLFDTLKAFETLKSSGFSEEQAKGLSDTLKVAQETSAEGLATKEDITKLELKVEDIKLELKADREKSKTDSVKWMPAFWATQIGIPIAAIAVLFKFFLK